MERLSDYLVFCDMDNTLLTAKEGIPACNRSVIRLFTAMGGRGGDVCCSRQQLYPRPPGG